MKKASNLSKLQISDITDDLGSDLHRHQGEFSDPPLDLTLLSDSSEENRVFGTPSIPQSPVESNLVSKFSGEQDGADSNRMEMIQQLNSLILSALPFDQLVGFALSIVTGAVQGTVASVLELDTEKNEFFFRASLGNKSATLDAVRVPASEGVVGRVASSRVVELIADTNGDDRHIGSISTIAGEDLSNCIAAPILINDSLFGVLEIFNRDGGGNFSEEDKKTVALAMPILAKVLEVRFFIAEVTK